MWKHAHSDFDMRMYLQVDAYAHVLHVAESAWPSLVLTEADYTQDNAHIILCPQCNVGGSEGGLVKDQTFSGFFSRSPSLIGLLFIELGSSCFHFP